LENRAANIHAGDRLSAVVEIVDGRFGKQEAILSWTLERAEPIVRNPVAGLETLVTGVFSMYIEQQDASIAQLNAGAFGDRPPSLFRTVLPLLR
jgi:hypothetical protein